jgi:hypothetical protein
MRVFVIFLILIKSVFASELTAVFDIPHNSRYKLVPLYPSLQAHKQIQAKNDVKVVKEEPTLILSGIFSVGNSYSALINGEPYSLNDEVSGYKIKKIDINSVQLTKKGKKVVIYVENN